MIKTKTLYVGDALPNPVFMEFLKIRQEIKADPTLYDGRYSCDDETAWSRYNLDKAYGRVPLKKKGK